MRRAQRAQGSSSPTPTPAWDRRHPRLAVRRLSLLCASFAALGALVVVAIGGAAPAASAAATQTCAGSAGPGALGVYAGWGDASGVRRFATGTGTNVAIASDYLPSNQGWAGMTVGGGVTGLLSAWQGTGCVLLLGVPMVPTDSSGNPQGTLAAGAAGSYDDQFATLARTLIAGGQPNAMLRLGWEFNGNWSAWQVTDTTDAANFAAYWRDIVTTMRAVPGAAFQFVWNPDDTSGSGSYAPSDAYPGNAYVDAIGIDVYDQCWCTPRTSSTAWTHLYDQPWGLQWATSFASAVGEPLAVPEWGVTNRSRSHGLGDDPSFILRFAMWIDTYHVVYTSYFNFNARDGAHDLFDRGFRRALAEFRRLHFGTPPA
jgi:hypothetical protein